MTEVNTTEIETLHKENIDNKIIALQLHHREQNLTQMNKKLMEKFKNIVEETDIKVQQYEQQIKQYCMEIKDLEEQKEQMITHTKELENLIQSKEQSFKDQQQEEKKKNNLEIARLNSIIDGQKEELDKLNDTKLQKQKNDFLMQKLQDDLNEEKKRRGEDVTNKEREKIQATEKLRKEMLYKIKETKANLLALNDEQLQTTTRLTILQNHQLTTELEYQSKQTEKLLFKNNQMKIKIDTLIKDVQIHKEVEKELAKRSHFCQKVIKRLKQQVKDFEDEKANNSQYGGVINRAQVPAIGGSGGNQRNRNNLKTLSNENNKHNEDLINFLEHKLEEIEKKLHKSQNDYEILQQDYIILQEKVNNSKEKYKRAALLMTEFLDDLLNQTPNILDSDKDMHLNLEKIKETPIENLDKEDKVALVLVLLKQLQPYLSANNLSTAPLQKNLKQHQFYGQQMTSPTNQNSFIRNQADDILRQHGASGTSAEVDALNSILNNINVQTKNQYNTNIIGNGGRLPPI